MVKVRLYCLLIQLTTFSFVQNIKALEVKIIETIENHNYSAAGIENISSNGKLLDIIINGNNILTNDKTTGIGTLVKLHKHIKKNKTHEDNQLYDSYDSEYNSYDSTLGGSFYSFGTDSNSNDLRSLLVRRNLVDDSNKLGDLRLAGSYLSYMGRAEILLQDGVWGSICGAGWDVKDATVVCRGLGFRIGGVIARPKMEFGRSRGPIVMSKVNCTGNENSIQECNALRWDTFNSLECDDEYSAAGLVCGCPLTSNDDTQSLCFLYTRFPFDHLYCKHSCNEGAVLVGDRRRHCENEQKWTGVEPRCLKIFPSLPRQECQISSNLRVPCIREHSDTKSRVNEVDWNPETCVGFGCCFDHTNNTQSPTCFVTADSPCTAKPCDNGGICRDFLGSTTKYECVCPEPYGGQNCEFRRDWGCGRQNIQPDLRSLKPTLRIVGGREAVKGSWPWIVQIREHDSYFCSGALIAPQWILTAGHCLKLRNIPEGRNENKYLTVLTGQHSSIGEDTTSTSVGVEYIFGHNFTNIDIPRQDIALIKLNRPVTANNFTSAVCLPNDKHETPLPGSKCWIAGWGNQEGNTLFPTSLQQGDIPILSNEDCRSLDDPDKDYSLLADSMICGGYDEGGVDACQGDSGGPLMCQRSDNSWYLAGIVSWGYGCADPYTPGVYTRVSHYLNWVYSNIDLSL